MLKRSVQAHTGLSVKAGCKVLVIAPHMDDEVLGCGGAIVKHSREKHTKVWVVFVAGRVYNHNFNAAACTTQKKHALKACKTLGYEQAYFLDLADERLDASIQDIIIPLEQLVKKLSPDTVYIPFRGDNNQDHRAVFDAARVVVRPAAASGIRTVYMYEIPSSTEQSPPLFENAFLPNYYVNITPFMETKIRAFSHYTMEQRAFPHPRSKKALRVLAAKRGSEAGCPFAEAFMLVRSIWI